MNLATAFLDCFALSRYSFKTQIIRYIGYAYNTDLFVSRWLISKSLEINAANLELRRNGLVYAFSLMLTQFDNRVIEGEESFW